MFIKKYKPKTIASMIGNRLQAGELKRALAERKRSSAIVLSGPPGCGKTLAIELAAAETTADIVTGSYDDLVAASSQSSVWGRGKVLVANLGADISVGDALKLAECSTWPVVFETTDIYQRNLFELRKNSSIKIIQFQKASAAEIANLAKRICISEGITCDERALYELAQRSDCDIRFTLIALESLSCLNSETVQEIDKDRVERIFDMLDSVFQRRAADVDIESIRTWILENIPERYTGKDLEQAYNCMAAASRFQRLGLDKYSEPLVRLIPQSRISAQYRPPRWVAQPIKK